MLHTIKIIKKLAMQGDMVVELLCNIVVDDSVPMLIFYFLSCRMYELIYHTNSFIVSSLGDKTVAGSDRSCVSSTSFGIQII